MNLGLIQKASILLFVIFLSGCFPEEDTSENLFTPDAEHSSAHILNVRLSPQQSQVWCWAAVIEMVSAYYGNWVAQCSTLSYWFSADCCTYAEYCQTTGTDYQIQQSFSALGIASSYWRAPLTREQSVGELDNGRPFIMFYQGSFSGHVVVAYGYNLEKKTLFIHDPYYGTFEVPYGQSFSYNGNMRWVQTLYGFSRV